ncbi:PepSY domain-containing protein [Alteribacillus sp. HJP-4]|uniref:PepSY domain-containing protein n=1 Tax=Alteribacillus sp. HJP-4 TaxID=2775394 RepID=UPI0035CCF241
MKKLIIATACVAVIGVTAVGIQQFTAFGDEQGSPGGGSDRLSIEEAKERAQDHYPGSVQEIELETDDGKEVYDMEIVGEKYKYELKLDANSGEVVHLDEKERTSSEKANQNDDNDDTEAADDSGAGENGDDKNSGSNSSSGYPVSMDEAIQIALDEVGGTVKEAELDEDDGISYYDFEINTDNGEAEVEVNAQTGEIIVISYDD